MKFKIKNLNDSYEVEEIEDEPMDNPVDDPANETPAAEPLTDEETAQIRSLLPYVKQLLDLVAPQEGGEGEEQPLEDEEPNPDEEVLDTDIDPSRVGDSKKSFGAIAKQKKQKDSIDNAIEIEDAWTKRYERRR